jgi:hypothetical protein
VAIEVRADDDTCTPEAISLLEIDDGQIAGINAFLDPRLVAKFGDSIES